METVMTNQPLRIPMVRERNAAVRAGSDSTAVNTLDERGIPAAVQEKNALFAAVHRFDNRIVERLTDHVAIIDSDLGHGVVIDSGSPQVYHFDGWQSPAANPLRQRQQSVLAG